MEEIFNSTVELLTREQLRDMDISYIHVKAEHKNTQLARFESIMALR